jgi:hypothetical protein
LLAVTNRQIPTIACLVATPSGCPVAVYLSRLYHSQARCSNRCGANIPRRIEIASESRIAACRVTLQMRSPETEPHDAEPHDAEPHDAEPHDASAPAVVRLTRSTLRWMGVCSSEASDLCIFFKMAAMMFPGMRIVFHSPTGQHLVLFECPRGHVHVE